MSNSDRGAPNGTNPPPPDNWLHRARRSLAKATRGWRPGPPVAEPPDWRAILAKGEMPGCPAAVYRQLSAECRKAGDPATAEKICTAGVASYPDHPALAVEHAMIAGAMDDPGLKLARWQRVIGILGDKSPSKAFKNLADCYQSEGDYQLAEAVVRRGMALFPEDFNLEERLARISLAAGFSARAIQQWSELIEHHPQEKHAWVHLRISDALRTEGLLDRAAAVLDQQLLKHPGEVMLDRAAANLAAVRAHPVNPAERVPPAAADGLAEFSAHLFTDRSEPFGRGKCAFPFRLGQSTKYLPAMLDFADCVTPLRESGQAEGVDVFVTWGAAERSPHDLGRKLAATCGKPNLCIDNGFVTSIGSTDDDSPRPSIIICPDVIHFDATRPTVPESKLNSSDYRLTDGQASRAAKCMEALAAHRITRHTHATQTDLRPLFPNNGKNRILLVDQPYGDPPVDKGLGGEFTFQRMLDEALATPDHEILVLLYPASRLGRRGSYLRPLLPERLPPNFSIIEFEVNPYCLFEVVDQVYVCNSHFGFEALLAGKEVHCFASPFYAGWGLTHDRSVVPRRYRHRSLDEIFHLFYIEHSRYHVPNLGAAELEDLVAFLVESKDSGHRPEVAQEIFVRSPAAIAAKPRGETLNILIIPIGSRFSASGRYTQNLAWSLCRLGCRVMVLAAEKQPTVECGVHWLPLAFDGMRLSASVREAIVNFAPDIIYENGVRSGAQRAALEAMILTHARLALQSEDDDVQVYETHHGKAAAQAMTLVDKPMLTADDIARFLQHNNWRLSLNVLFDPGYDHWVEPITRALCYRLASLHTVVWHPFAERLERDYGVSSFVVPPVASAADFERLLPSSNERESILRQYGIEPDHVVFFIGGALYSFSSEYAYFLDALNRTAAKNHRPMALVISSGRSSLPIARMARERLRPEIAFADIGHAGDEVYMEMLKACDVVCSPGLPDTFNRFRLPSRLVKAMAMGKPVLTCRCGFGESLENGTNAFLTEGEDPAEWAETIVRCLDDVQRAAVGNQGRAFANEHFNSDRVAAALKEKFEAMLADPANPLANGILHGAADPEAAGIAKARAHSGIKLRSRHHSTMQDAIHLLATRCNRLHTVVHIGAGRCGEFDDYCRLGAERIVLIEALPELATRLRELANINGRIIVKQAVVAATRGPHPAFILKNTRTDSGGAEEFGLLRPSRLLDWMPCIQVVGQETVNTCTIPDVCADLTLEQSHRNMLVLELQGLEAQALDVVPKELLQRFEWIAMRLSEEPLYEMGATRETVEALLKDAGFARVPAPLNFSELMIPELFQREPNF